MAKGFLSSLRTFFKNMRGHTKRVLTRKESAGKALRGVSRDVRKLRHTLKRPSGSEDRQAAKRLVRRGRSAYNAANYDAAENLFRRAILEDQRYARSYTYLGHTLYQMGRFKEAAKYWEQAIQVDPHSEAAGNALQKLQHLDRTKGILDRWVNDRLEGR